MPPVACYFSRISLAEIGLWIARAQTPDFHAAVESRVRDGLPPWFGELLLEVSERVLPRWRMPVWEGQKDNYTYPQPTALLAATALEYDLGVVTRNIEDFERVGLRLLNPWLQTATA